MGDFVEIINEQDGVINSIKKLATNVAKDPKDRKNANYLKKKLNDLNTYWVEFKRLDALLKEFYDDHQDHGYWTQERDKINAIYIELKKKLTECLQTQSAADEQLAQQKKVDTRSVVDLENLQCDDKSPKDTQNTDEGLQNFETKAGPSKLITDLKEFEQGSTPKINNNILVVLRRKRTIFMDFVKKLILTEESTAAFIRHAIQTLNEHWKSISETMNLLLKEVNDGEFECAVSTFSELEGMYQISSVQLQERLEEFQNSREKPENSENKTASGIKLPKIVIPIFNGDYSKWREFHDLFTEIIHKNNKISNIEKLQYLKTSLEGEGLKPISHLELTNENYIGAWQLLKGRFENTRIIVGSIIETLLNQQNATNTQELKRLHDTTRECLHSLARMKVETISWDPILMNILEKKLDKDTRILFEQGLKNPKEVPSIQTFLEYLEQRFQLLDSFTKSKPNVVSQKAKISTQSFMTNKVKCSICAEDHSVINCNKFLKMPILKRREEAKIKKLCFNCLSATHHVYDCQSSYSCRTCKKWHHSLLHYESTNTKSSEKNTTTSATKVKDSQMKSLISNKNSDVLLATAMLTVKNIKHQKVTLRALLDQGSQATFITEAAARILQLPVKRSKSGVTGLGAADAGTTNGKLKLEITPRYPSSFKINVEAYILPVLTQNLPSNILPISNDEQLRHIVLADPKYNTPGSVDILIGADYYGNFILEGLLKQREGGLTAQQTELGWIIFGPIMTVPDVNKIRCFISNKEIDQRLQTFWEQEELTEPRIFTDDEMQAEKLYESSVSRNDNGTYVVRLPIKECHPPMGKTRGQAIARLLQMENRFLKNAEFHKQYKAILDEYLMLGHMRLIGPEEFKNTRAAYLPHHAVIKEKSSTTRMRIVFDGSAKSSSGITINDIQLVGPTIQHSLFEILLRWRKHKFAFTADIEKMYRQIQMQNDDQHYQRIVWRENIDKPIQDYCLTTVTFGTAAAPYLAIKTLHQIAKDDGHKYPVGAKILTNDFYVDDVLSGENTMKEALIAKAELINLLQGGGFNLRKWYSNNALLQDDVSDSGCRINNTISTLGIQWDHEKDTIRVNVEIPTNLIGKITKRVFLSEASKIYDPLGWLSPSTIKTKILFQSLWTTGLKWDQQLPSEIQNQWHRIKKESIAMETISIPRWNHYSKDCKKFEIHGFCDASEKAYAAVIYTRSTNVRGDIKVTMMCAKTKVAPINQRVTLPRLELCGAVLLASLIQQVIKAMEIESLEVFAWTDSTIVLAWLRGEPNRWKTFVANRVGEINSILQPSQWHHVNSKENPADCASRGLFPDELVHHALWWNGPEWLQKDTFNVDNEELYTTETDVEKRKVKSKDTINVNCIQANVATCDDFIDTLLQRYTSWHSILTIFSFTFRFVHNARVPKSERRTGWLTRNELERTEKYIIKIVQSSRFTGDITSLKRSGVVTSNSKLKALAPFLDKDDILRVGGRISNSDAPYATKHPIILPSKHPVTTMILRDAHIKHLHPGPSLMMSILRQTFWIIGGKEIIRQFIHRCVICFRHKQHTSQQLMGQLPTPRVTASRPFLHTGIDYAGPIPIKTMKGRGGKSVKGYIVVFVCLATKAIHLEVAGDLTSDSCLAAIKRFISRRGLPSDIYSDNGTNFVGARRQLNEMDKLIRMNTFNEQIAKSLIAKSINWHMIPPSAPHFGGLWEAGVKSTKHHLKRVIGESILTLEELYTLLTQIEAILNSRPLSILSSDQLDPLTPAHFLIGQPLTLIPESSLENIKINRLSRWQLIQQMTQGFWKRWSTEYLNTLQQRPKNWQMSKTNIKINDVALIKDDNIPPTRWLMGRITELHPGKDGLVRVVTLTTKNGVVKRPTSKLAILPIEENKPEALESDSSNQVNDVPATLTCNLGLTNRNYTKRHTSQKYKINSVIFLITWIIITLLRVPEIRANSKGFSITSFHHQPGIYFEGLGLLNKIESYWKLIIIFDSASYSRNVNDSRTCMTNMKDLNTAPDGIYTNIYNLLQYQLVQIERNDILMHVGGRHNNSRRKKRGLVDIVGNAASALFGVLDQNDAHQYNKQFQELLLNEDHLLQLLKNQTTITDLTIDALKKDEWTINKQFSTIMKIMKEEHIREAIRNNDTMRLGLLTSMTQYCSLLISNTQQLQNTIMDILLFSHQGNVHPSLLTTTQLNRELSVIRQHIPKHLSILGDHQKDGIFTIYKLMTARAGKADSKIIVEVRIPLVNDETFQLYKIISVPTMHQGKFTYIKGSSKYIAVDLSREHYIPMSEQDIKECIWLNAKNSVCKVKSPVFTISSNQSLCEMNLLQHKKEYAESCQIKITKKGKNWIPMYADNSWVYSFKEQTTVDIICNQNINSLTLSGNGILQLDTYCMIREDDLIITAAEEGQSSIKASFIPILNISMAIKRGSIIPEENELHPETAIFTGNDLQKIQRLVEYQRIEEDSFQNMNYHDIHHYTMSYTIAILILILVMIWYFRRRQKARAERRPVPRPRQRHPLRDLREVIEVDEIREAGQDFLNDI